MSLNRFRTRTHGRLDPWLLLAVVSLVGFGLVMISSASVVLSSEFYDSSYVFASRQLWSVGVGAVAMALGALIDYRVWQRLAPWLLGVILLLLVLTLLPGVGTEVKGAQRWISLGGFQFQPSEPIKLLAIFYFSAWFAARQEHVGSLVRGFLPFVTVLGMILLLIMAQPDAGTAITSHSPR